MSTMFPGSIWTFCPSEEAGPALQAHVGKVVTIVSFDGNLVFGPPSPAHNLYTVQLGNDEFPAFEDELI